jgi:hypothetical protein
MLMKLTPAANFINILRTNFLYIYDISAAFPNYMYVEKAAEMTFVRKMCAYNVDEIDTWKSTTIHVTSNADEKRQNFSEQH